MSGWPTSCSLLSPESSPQWRRRARVSALAVAAPDQGISGDRHVLICVRSQPLAETIDTAGRAVPLHRLSTHLAGYALDVDLRDAHSEEEASHESRRAAQTRREHGSSGVAGTKSLAERQFPTKIRSTPPF